LESAVKVAPAGTVLVLVRGMGLAKGLPVSMITSPSAFNQDIKGLVPSEMLVPSFLAWALRFKAADLLADRQTVTHGTLKLDTGLLERLSIPVPSMEVQMRVARQLDDDFIATDSTVAHAMETSKAMEKLPATLLRRAFSGAL
jgi:type I restriction enzyme S subunit